MEDVMHEGMIQLSMENSSLSSTFKLPQPAGPTANPKFILRSEWLFKA
jgi:hypothetical protein